MLTHQMYGWIFTKIVLSVAVEVDSRLSKIFKRVQQPDWREEWPIATKNAVKMHDVFRKSVSVTLVMLVTACSVFRLALVRWK